MKGNDFKNNIIILVIENSFHCLWLSIKSLIKLIRIALCSLIKLCQIINDKLILYTANYENTLFKTLVPTDEAEGVEEYISVLEWAINQKDIYNIGVTASYGAGKSSVIKTFFRKHPSIKFINVSLAMFKDADSKDIKSYKYSEDVDEDDNPSLKKIISNDCEELLERGILEQLFYKVKNERIPKSRFQKIYKSSFVKVFLWTLILIGVAAFIAWVYDSERFMGLFTVRLNRYNNYSKNVKFIISMMSICVVLVTVEIIRKLLSLISQIDVHIGGNASINMKKDENGSPFSKNMDEILYFFERTNYSIVVFEDMDRFNAPMIFVKLRELNRVLNNYEKIKQRVIFIYAVKDDVFNVENRAKFFDFLIPVVPYMGTSNIYSQLKKEFSLMEKAGICKNISVDFLKTISLYIKDLRVLKNIMNEYLLYKKVINNDYLDDEKFYSLIVLKNLYPVEFEVIQQGDGIIQAFFDAKDIFVEKIIKKIDEDIEGLKKKKTSYMDEPYISMKEMKKTWFYQAARSIYISSFTAGNNNYSLEEVLKNSFNMNILVENNTIAHVSRNSIGVVALDKIVASDGITYYEHWKNMYAYRTEEQERLAEEIKEKEIEKDRILRLDIPSFDEEYNINNIIIDCKNSELVNFVFSLLRGGYINNNYLSFINLFKDDDIYPYELNYLNSVNSHSGKNNWDVNLKNPQNVVNRLKIEDYGNPEVLNYDLMDCLLSEGMIQNKGIILSKIKKQISINDESYKFIVKYYLRGKNIENLLNSILKGKNDFWLVFVSNSVTTVQDKIKLLRDLYLNYELEEIMEQNSVAEKFGAQYSIRYFIRENPESLQLIQNIDLEKLNNSMAEMNVKFYTFSDLNKLDNHLVDYIYENNLYEINYEMMTLFISRKLDVVDSNYGMHLYTTLLENDELAKMYEYINENIEQYYSEIIINNVEMEESINAVWELCQLLGFEREKMEIIISNNNFIVDDIESIGLENDATQEHQAFLDICISLDKVKPTINNLCLYEKYFGRSDYLIKYVNSNCEILQRANTENERKGVVWLILNDRDNLVNYITHVNNDVIDLLEEDSLSYEELDVLIASEVEVEKKINIIRRIKPKEYTQRVANFCVENKIILGKESLIKIIEMSNYKYEQILENEKMFNVEELTRLVTSITEWVPLLTENEFVIDHTENAYKLAKLLKNKAIVHEVHKKKDKIIITVKYINNNPSA